MRHPRPQARPLVKIISSGRRTNTEILSEAARTFGVDNHIVAARIDSAGGATFGILLVEITGRPEDAKKTLDFFKSQNINTEVLGYV